MILVIIKKYKIFLSSRNAKTTIKYCKSEKSIKTIQKIIEFLPNTIKKIKRTTIIVQPDNGNKSIANELKKLMLDKVLHQLNNKSMSSKFLQLAILLALAAILGALSCSSNQYYVNDQLCVNCPANCSTCSNGDFCTSCIDNFYLVKGAFNVTCQTCSKIFVGCSVCLSNVACTRCAEGFYLQNFGCSPCNKKTLFCASCSQDGNTCTQCAYPFILVRNLCVSGTINSITGNPGANPISSDTNNAATNSSSTNTTKMVTLPNGIQVAAVIDANGCNQIQIYVFGQCFKTIPQCRIYQQNGLCQYCANGYLVTIFGDCSPSNRVLNCEDGFWQDAVNDQCVKVSVACDWYYPNNGSCFNCSTGYTWVNSTCVQSIKCNSRQFFESGFCIDVPPQCLTFASNGNCLTCAINHSLRGGFCVRDQNPPLVNNRCKFPCNTCLDRDLGYCYSCVQHYQLENARYGTCIPIVN